MIQSVLIPRDKYTLAQAVNWIQSNGYKVHFGKKPPDITVDFYRFRQKRPNPLLKYHTIKTAGGIEFIVMN